MKVPTGKTIKKLKLLIIFSKTHDSLVSIWVVAHLEQ